MISSMRSLALGSCPVSFRHKLRMTLAVRFSQCMAERRTLRHSLSAVRCGGVQCRSANGCPVHVLNGPSAGWLGCASHAEPGGTRSPGPRARKGKKENTRGSMSNGWALRPLGSQSAGHLIFRRLALRGAVCDARLDLRFGLREARADRCSSRVAL